MRQNILLASLFLDTTMAKLVFSKGLLIEQDPKGFCISHDDDIVIEANIQLPLRMLKSKKHLYSSIN